MNYWYSTGRETSINNLMHSWALDAQGFCFSCNIFVKILPNFGFDDYEIMGFFHKINDRDYIITDYDGGKKNIFFIDFNRNFGNGEKYVGFIRFKTLRTCDF